MLSVIGLISLPAEWVSVSLNIASAKSLNTEGAIALVFVIGVFVLFYPLL